MPDPDRPAPPPGPPPGRPPKWKTAVLTFAGLYPPLVLVLATLGPVLSDWPLPARTAVVAGVLVPAMVFVIMPALTKLAGGWLRR